VVTLSGPSSKVSATHWTALQSGRGTASAGGPGKVVPIAGFGGLANVDAVVGLGNRTQPTVAAPDVTMAPISAVISSRPG